MRRFDNFVEEICLCGRTWRGKPGCSFQCDDCGPDAVSEDELEEFEENRRRKIAERNEY